MHLSGVATAWLKTPAAGQTLTGASGPEQLSDSFGHAPTLIGGSGDDTFNIIDPNTKIIGTANGLDTVQAWCDFVLPDHGEDLTIEQNLSTGVANNMGDLLIAVGRNDTLVGGTGADVFVDAGAG